MDFKEIGWEDVDWIIMAQDKHKQQVLIKMARNPPMC